MYGVHDLRQRRYIPSLSLLLAFEAVVRHQSVTAAAAELNLTQSTVSRLVQNLEQQLGCALFLRQRKRLIPTEAARSYSRELSRAIDLIQRASMTLIANPTGGNLSLAVLPTWGTRWLAPRLNLFFEAHPGVSVNFATRVQRFSFGQEAFDAVIFFGEPDWPGARHMKLFDEHLTACAAPDFLRRHPVATAADMAGLPLLQLETRLTAWHDWFAGQGAPVPRVSGMMLDQFSMMIQAAIAGLGVALLPDYLAQIEIEEGRLAPVLRRGVPGAGSYWLAWPEEKTDDGPLMAFRDWLQGCAGAAAPR